MIEDENLLDRATALSELFRTRFLKLQQQCDQVREVRILGLMIGIELAQSGSPVVQACMERKLLINCTQNTVLRLLPAMTLTDQQAEEGCDILADVIQTL
jgi:acetylornithine/succinyldiaminopimelate/putrescine aminotransferase